jgi:Homeodomain-like domain
MLPTNLLCRRRDSVEVIGSALALAADGMGCQEVGDTLERSQSTVRDWKRRIRDHATEIRVHFTRLAVRLDSGVEIAPTGSPFSDAIAAIGAAGRAAVLRQVAKHPWWFASFATTSMLLSNTNPSWTDP